MASIINSFQSFSFVASLGAMTGKDIPLLPAPPETLLRLVEGERIWGMGDNVATHPLFRPRDDRHTSVPLELLRAKSPAPFEEGARVYLELHSDLREGVSDFPNSAEGEVRMAAGGWFRRLFSPPDPVQKFFKRVDKKILRGDPSYFSTPEFRQEIETLSFDQRFDLALAIEARLGDGSGGFRGVAVEALQSITPHLAEGDRLDRALAIEARLGDEDGYGYVRGVAVEALQSITPHLAEGDRLTLALAIEARLGDESGDVRLAAVRALESITPHLSDPDRRRLERLKEGKGASVGALFRILKQLTDYNRNQVLGLLKTAIREIDFQREEFPTTFHFWADIFERWPRLGFPVLEGLVEGVKKGLVSKAPEVKEREGLLRFIAVTHGFVPAVYAAWRRDGEKVLEEIQGYGEEILSEGMGVKELHVIAKTYSADGGMEFVLAVIQSVSPTSGASFVKRKEQIGLLNEMLEAGDRREDIPKRWRGVVRSFELEQGSWRLKEGDVADSEGKLRALLEQFRAGEGKKRGEAEAVEGLKAYLESERREEDLDRVRGVLFGYAGSQDTLREKIDRIQDNDYSAVELLDQLFRDKDNLTVLIRDLLDKIPPAFLVDKKEERKRVPLSGNVDKLVSHLRAVLNNPKLKEEEARVRVIANMLSRYTPESIEGQLLTREDVRETPLEELINRALSEDPALSKGKFIETILSGPLALIEAEKKKFAYQAGELTKIGLRAVKGPAFGMFGLTAGVCTATDIALWKKAAFKLLAITDENDRQVVGYIQLFESKDEAGRRILTLPGINPSTEFMGTVETESFYAKLMEKVIEFAKLEKYHAVYIPTNKNIHSNRAGIQKTIQNAGHPVAQIPEVRWNTLPKPYPFSEVYGVWEKDPSP